MGAKTVNKKLIKKLNRIRNPKNCIPKKVIANDPGEYDGVDEYRDYRPHNIHVTIKDRPGKGRKLNKQPPWYKLTKTESIAIESRRKTTKMTHEEYVKAYLKQKLTKWESKHPKPKEDDVFYKEEYPLWVSAREEAHDKIVSQLQKYINKYTKPLIHHVLESRNNESVTMYSKAA